MHCTTLRGWARSGGSPVRNRLGRGYGIIEQGGQIEIAVEQRIKGDSTEIMMWFLSAVDLIINYERAAKLPISEGGAKLNDPNFQLTSSTNAHRNRWDFYICKKLYVNTTKIEDYLLESGYQVTDRYDDPDKPNVTITAVSDD